jgi:hypothetical protein
MLIAQVPWNRFPGHQPDIQQLILLPVSLHAVFHMLDPLLHQNATIRGALIFSKSWPAISNLV